MEKVARMACCKSTSNFMYSTHTVTSKFDWCR